MAKLRKRHSAQYKFKLALEAAKEQQTINELASHYRVHPNQISQWKRLLKGVVVKGKAVLGVVVGAVNGMSRGKIAVRAHGVQVLLLGLVNKATDTPQVER